MSTKIYNGYRVWAENLDSAIAVLNSPKQAVKEKLHQLALSSFLKKAIVIHDINILNNTCLPKTVDDDESLLSSQLSSSSLSETFNSVRKELQEEIKKGREPKKEYEVMHCIYPEKFYDEVSNQYYYLFTYHGENELQEWYFEQLPTVEEYGYWNNTDWPDGMSEENWEKRENDWNHALLNKSGVPAEDGLSLTVGRESVVVFLMSPEEKKLAADSLEELTKEYTLEQRIEHYGNLFITNKYMKVLNEKNNINPDNIISTYMKASRQVRANDIPDDLKELKILKEKEISAVLKEITYDVLNTKLDILIEDAKKIILAVNLDESLKVSNIKIKQNRI